MMRSASSLLSDRLQERLGVFQAAFTDVGVRQGNMIELAEHFLPHGRRHRA